MRKSIKALIAQTDWASYENAVFLALQGAVEKYNGLYAQDESEKVSQVSLWTDPQAAVTAINFDTTASFMQYKEKEAIIYRQESDEEMALEVEALELQGNPAEFKHLYVVQMDNPELHLLQEAGFSIEKQEAAVLERINQSLVAVVERAKQEGVFTRLHREPVIEVGVNSPLDWYDSVQRL